MNGKDNSARMQCMEVWGGNQAVERAVETAGLKIWVYSRPYGQAHGGGDVHYLSSCASGRITRMLLADVSGHGETAAKFALGLRDLMRQNVNYIKQARFVDAMNRQFTQYSASDLFATALVSTFFAPTQSFTLCNAGHPSPLVFRLRESTWSELNRPSEDPDRFADAPLGIQDEMTFQEVELKLRTGDMVLSFSDAVTESVDASGDQLGPAGLLRLAQQIGPAQPEEVISTLVNRLTNLAPGNLEQDDVTLLLIQATGGGTTLKNNLLAPFRLFGQVTDRTNLSD